VKRSTLLLALFLAGCPGDPAPTTTRPRATAAPTSKPAAVATPTPAPTPTPDPRALVLGPDAQPAANVLVRGYVGDTPTLETRTDARGRFTLAPKDGGAFTVEAVLNDQVKAIAQHVTTTDGLTLALAPVGSLDGRVTAPAAPGAKDLAGIEVRVPGTGYAATTDASGHYHVSAVAAGTYVLNGHKTGLGGGRLDGQAVAPGATSQLPDLVLTPLVPGLTGLAPAVAGPGAVLTLTGDPLGPGTLEVRFPGVSTPVVATLKDEHTAEVVVPAGATTGEVAVLLDGVASAGKPFTVVSKLEVVTAIRAMRPGERHRFVVRAYDGAGKPVAAPAVSWVASGPALEMGADGSVTAKAVGSATLTASVGTLTAAPITVDVSDGTVVSTLAGVAPGATRSQPTPYEGVGTAVELGLPRALAVATDDTLYVADGKGWISTVSPDGEVKRLVELPEPRAIAVDFDRTCYVATAHKIVKVGREGKVTDYVGAPIAGSADGTGAAASFNGPLGLAVTRDGNLFVHDTGNAKLRLVTPAGVVSTLNVAAAGTHGVGLFDAGPIALSPDGNTLYLAGPGVAFGRFDVTSRARPLLVPLVPEPFTPGANDVAPKAVEGLAADTKGRVAFLDGRYLRLVDPSIAGHTSFTTLAGFAAAQGKALPDGPGATAGTADLMAIAASPTQAGVYYFLEASPDGLQQRVRRLSIAP
jgi:hypothetical protein